MEDWQGFPFNTLTEDYELTLYSTLNNLTTTYNEKAIFYDEQPDSFKVSKAKYIDLDSKDSDMQVSFDVKAISDEAKSKLKYLDENIRYIIDDNVKYYSK